MTERREDSRSIVRYTTDEAPFDGYPDHIVSPPTERSCCVDEMAPLGSRHWEDQFLPSSGA
jgi:hypothetical protein